jgi:hypothetical protein
MRTSALLALLIGCGNTPHPQEVTRVDGEVTLHEFDSGWTHAWAVFVDGGVPLDEVRYDSILSLPPTPFATVGACEVTRRPSCGGPCPGGWCYADGECRIYPPRRYLDDGPLRIINVAGGPVADVRLAFDAATGLYDSTPPPGAYLVFRGGESLSVSLSGRWSTTLDAPERLALVSPGAPLRVPTDGPLHFAWTAGEAELVEILLVVSSDSDGDWLQVRCRADDVGAFDLPAEILAQAPPPPRSARVEVTRNAEDVVPTRAGGGVLVHAGYTVALDSY